MHNDLFNFSIDKFLGCFQFRILPESLFISLGKITVSRIIGPRMRSLSQIYYFLERLNHCQFLQLNFMRDFCSHWYFILPYISQNGELIIFLHILFFFKCEK